jgi:hypothetical protein
MITVVHAVIMRKLRTESVAGFLSFLLGLLTREDGTDTLSRNIGKQLAHNTT